MVFAALFLYLAFPITATILTHRKMDEGRVWLLALFSELLALIFLLIHPVTSGSETLNHVWFSSSALILTSDSLWDRAVWLNRLLIGLVIVIRIALNYVRRIEKPFSRYETWNISVGAVLGIIALGVNQIFLLAIGWTLLDGLWVVRNYFEEKELFKSRREVLALLLRLISILIIVFLSLQSDVIISNIASGVIISLILLVIVLRLLAIYLDQLSINPKFQMNTDWMLYLNIMFLVKMLSVLSTSLVLTGITYLFISIPVVLITGVFIFLIFKKIDPGMTKFNVSVLVVNVALFGFFLGVRSELLYMLLPLYFLMFNEQLSELSKGHRTALVLFEMIFMVGYTFSPFYSLNDELVNSGVQPVYQYVLLGLEGLLLASFLINQQFETPHCIVHRHEFTRSLIILVWFVIAILILSTLKGFFIILPVGRVSWTAFIPLVVAGGMFALSNFFAKKKTGGNSIKVGAFSLSKRLIDSIARIFLVLVNLLRQLFEGITSILEGDGGLIWAIIFLILLLTLYKGIVQI